MKNDIKNNKPKILFVGAFPPAGSKIFGGMVTACTTLLNSNFPNIVDLITIDTTQISNPPPSFVVRLFIAIKRMFLFFYKFEKNKPDGVFLFVADGASLIEKGTMAWYTKIRNKKAYIFPRAGSVINQCRESKRKLFITKLFLKGAHKLICQGEQWHLFAQEYLGFEHNNLPIIKNWTATDNLITIGKNKNYALNANNSTLKILFIAWLERKKGIYELIDASNLLMTNYKNKNIEVYIAGDGVEHDQIKAYITKNCLHPDNYLLQGWVNKKEINELLKQCNIFVLPSYSEGFPNALIEAMAAKLIPIVTAVGNIPTYIKHNENGILIQPKNKHELYQALNQIIENPNNANEIAQNAFDYCVENFSTEKAINELIKIIE